MIRITTLGSYHITNLIHSFSYIDSIIVDTPIFNEEVRSRIIIGQPIQHRLERSLIFIDYLDEIWNKINIDKKIYNWNSDSNQIRAQINEIQLKISET